MKLLKIIFYLIFGIFILAFLLAKAFLELVLELDDSKDQEAVNKEFNEIVYSQDPLVIYDQSNPLASYNVYRDDL